MDIYKRVISVAFIWVCFLLLLLFGCGYRPEYFSEEELKGYKSPIVFCKSKEDGRKYFMRIDEPEHKVYLEFQRIWDYDLANQKFLFTVSEDEIEKIYEYDIQSNKIEYLTDELSIRQYLQISEEEDLESIYYYPSGHEISGVYGDILFIYNKIDSEYICKTQLPDILWGEAYGWLNANTFLFTGDFRKTFEVNVVTGEVINLENDLVNSIYVSADNTVGCSSGDENWFGAIFSPILFWDTTDYNIKRFHEGITSVARLQVSDDHKYILFERGSYREENDKLLCIRIEDEKLCTVYETKDNIMDLLW